MIPMLPVIVICGVLAQSPQLTLDHPVFVESRGEVWKLAEQARQFSLQAEQRAARIRLPLPAGAVQVAARTERPLRQMHRLRVSQVASRQTVATQDVGDHLRAAIHHLRQAGYADEADRIEQQAKRRMAEQLRELKEKRRQLEELKCQIAQLEDDLDIGSAYMVQVTAAEIAWNELEHLNAELHWDGNRVPFTKLFAPDHGIRVLPADMVKEVLRSLEQHGVANIHARSSLTVHAEQIGQLVSGGEIPVAHFHGDLGAGDAMRELGLQVAVRVDEIGAKRVHLTAQPQLAQVDFRHMAVMNGHRIPAITRLASAFSVEMELGQTALVCLKKQKDGQAKLGLFAITPTALREEPRPLHQEAKLQPIPDPNLPR